MHPALYSASGLTATPNIDLAFQALPVEVENHCERLKKSIDYVYSNFRQYIDSIKGEWESNPLPNLDCRKGDFLPPHQCHSLVTAINRLTPPESLLEQLLSSLESAISELPEEFSNDICLDLTSYLFEAKRKIELLHTFHKISRISNSQLTNSGYMTGELQNAARQIDVMRSAYRINDPEVMEGFQKLTSEVEKLMELWEEIGGTGEERKRLLGSASAKDNTRSLLDWTILEVGGFISVAIAGIALLQILWNTKWGKQNEGTPNRRPRNHHTSHTRPSAPQCQPQTQTASHTNVQKRWVKLMHIVPLNHLVKDVFRYESKFAKKVRTLLQNLREAAVSSGQPVIDANHLWNEFQKLTTPPRNRSPLEGITVGNVEQLEKLREVFGKEDHAKLFFEFWIAYDSATADERASFHSPPRPPHRSASR